MMALLRIGIEIDDIAINNGLVLVDGDVCQPAVDHADDGILTQNPDVGIRREALDSKVEAVAPDLAFGICHINCGADAPDNMLYEGLREGTAIHQNSRVDLHVSASACMPLAAFLGSSGRSDTVGLIGHAPGYSKVRPLRSQVNRPHLAGGWFGEGWLGLHYRPGSPREELAARYLRAHAARPSRASISLRSVAK